MPWFTETGKRHRARKVYTPYKASCTKSQVYNVMSTPISNFDVVLLSD